MTEPVYAWGLGGLGNRIKALLSALRLSSCVAVVWPPEVDGHFRARFGHLFLNDWEADHLPPAGARIQRSWQFLV